MRVEKKQITKEDGRNLIYYHFVETATAEEAEVFEAIEAPKTSLQGQSSPETPKEGKTDV